MIVVLTGTPGTGKTSVARELDYNTIDLTSFIEENSLGVEVDGEFEVETEEVMEELKDQANLEEDTLVEGHLAHHFPADYCIVLRCQPDVLRERLSERDYSNKKVEENVEAEAMDLMLSEAVQEQEKVIEIDTTNRDAKDVAAEIEKRMEEEDAGYGEVDWSDHL